MLSLIASTRCRPCSASTVSVPVSAPVSSFTFSFSLRWLSFTWLLLCLVHHEVRELFLFPLIVLRGPITLSFAFAFGSRGSVYLVRVAQFQ